MKKEKNKKLTATTTKNDIQERQVYSIDIVRLLSTMEFMRTLFSIKNFFRLKNV